jgi:hypothetical protein
MTEAVKVKKPITDMPERMAKREELRTEMAASLKAQGAFGVNQTQRWLKVYKRATRSISREVPGTQKAQQKLINELQDVCKPWTRGL